MSDLFGQSDPPFPAKQQWSPNHDASAVAYFVRVPSPLEEPLKCCRQRLLMAVAVLALLLLVIGGRMANLAIFTEEKPRNFQVSRHAGPALNRADLLDRNGQLLATNLMTSSVYADPQVIPDPALAAQKLSGIFQGLDAKDLMFRLASDKSFVWIRRNITPQQQYEVNKLGIPGLHFQTEERRIYPQGRLLAHILGYVSVDNDGIAGIERTLNERITDPEAGPLQLSVDLRVQHAIHDVLSRGIEEFEAKAGVGLVADVNSGEIIGMVSLPDFDPHHPGSADSDAKFNRATLGVYEMGSTFKTFTLAMALESNRIKIPDQVDARFPIRFAGFTINDTHPEHRFITVPEVFMHSSNIGTVKIVEKVGAKGQKEFLQRLGLLAPIEVELPERGIPLVPSPWSDIQMMTVSYGHGIAVSPLHVARAMSSMVNGGKLLPLTLLKREENPESAQGIQQVIRPEVSQEIRKLLRLVVEEGTGGKAEAVGYRVGGKTGTAEKPVNGRYQSKALITSFVGVFPTDQPKYVTIMLLDEPKGLKKTHGFATAGWNAAPLTSQLINRIGPILGVAPKKLPPVEFTGVSPIVLHKKLATAVASPAPDQDLAPQVPPPQSTVTEIPLEEGQ